MGFLAPAIPFAIKAGATIGTSLLGSKLSKSKPNPQAQNALNQQSQAQAASLAGGKNLLSQGQQTTQPVLNYWSSILSGNRGAMTSALGPELSRMGQGYQQAAQTSAALSPRGGPSAAFLSQLPFQQQRDTTQLFQTMRPQAAQQMGSLGNNLLSHGANLMSTSTAAGRGIADSMYQQQQLEAERGKSMGAGLFDILQKYGFPAIDKILKGGGGGTPTGVPPPGTNPNDNGPWKY